MAKYVIAGKADCPFYAKAEMLADELQLILVDFKVHKIVVDPGKWQEWLKETCEERGWRHDSSPIVWRELVDRGGKGLLIGGCDDFMEMAETYYGVRSKKMSDELRKIAEENLATKQAVDEEKAEAAKAINPLRVAITAAASLVSYSVLNSLLSGEIFGYDQDISVSLLDTPERQDELEGIVMEVQDCAWDLLRDVSRTSNANEVFKKSDLIIMLDTVSSDEQNEGSESNAKVFKHYAEIIEKNAKMDAKIIICGTNANLYATVLTKVAISFPKHNIHTLSRLQENRAKAAISRKLNVNSSGIIDLIVWGCPGDNDFIDISKSQVKGYDGAIWAPHIKTFSRSVTEMVHDDQWIAKEFLEEVNNHGSVLQVHNMCPSMSTAGAILDFIQDWWQSSCDQMTSLGVVSEGWYGIPDGIVFSFPVKLINGSWEVVEDLQISEVVQSGIQEIGKNLKIQTEQIMKTLN